ncbi:MAG: VWA domain-containing protein [Polyangiales bacterium]
MSPARSVYPWSAVVGQAALKQALVLCAIDPAIGGVLIRGPRGVAKTTLARALSELVVGPFVELPLGATEERVTGTLDLQRALEAQQVQFAPGLLARADGGVLYVDEVNLLPDALVDLLLDAAASGQNVIERDGVSHQHSARFVLVGTMNPEEGELRPQLLDRFGLCATAEAEIAPHERIEIVRRRLAYDRDPVAFSAEHAGEQHALIERCAAARLRLKDIPLDAGALEHISDRCHRAGVEGVRADIAMLRAARAHAAWQGRTCILTQDVDAVAELALAHRRSARGGGGGGRGGPVTPRGGAAPSGSGPGPAPSSGASGPPDTTSTSHADGGRDAAKPDSGGAAPNSPAANGGGTHTAPTTDDAAASPAGHSDTNRGRRGGAASEARGAMPAVPVRASAPPKLPPGFGALPGQLPAAQRRGRARLHGHSGARGRGAARDGVIDWFASLIHERRPRRSQLRYRTRRAPAQQLWILVVDCSTSMLRSGALAAAKGVALACEASAARAGARVALISFRGASAELHVTTRAGRSVLEQNITALGGGGGTPLRAAIEAAYRLCRERSYRPPAIAKRLVLLTDGRCREDLTPLAFERPPELETLVIDCERGRVRLGRTPELATSLSGSYHSLDSLI